MLSDFVIIPLYKQHLLYLPYLKHKGTFIRSELTNPIASSHGI
jgi:hypothetical protein